MSSRAKGEVSGGLEPGVTESALWQEIQSQPEVVARLLRQGREPAGEMARVWRERRPAFVFIAARGSSDNAGRYGQYVLGGRHSLPTGLATPSLHTRYGTPPDYRGGAVIGISQSGQTPDILRVVEEAAAQGALTLAITNDAGSPLARAAQLCLPLGADEERSIAATKTYTAQLAGLALLSATLRGDELSELARLPAWMARTLEQASTLDAGPYREAERCAVLARGFNFATACEIALKLKELALLPAEPFSGADYRHGPIALAEEGSWAILVASRGPALEDVQELARELGAGGGRLLVIGNDAELGDRAEMHYSFPGEVPDWLSPIVAVLPGQVLSFRLAQARGLDPDHPRLDRKVTRTL